MDFPDNDAVSKQNYFGTTPAFLGPMECMRKYNAGVSPTLSIKTPNEGGPYCKDFMEETMRVLILILFIMQLAVLVKWNW